MKILVTGGAGYIGSHCVISACEGGHEVTVFDNLSTGHMETVGALGEMFENMRFEEGDLRNPEDIDGVISQGNFDAVIHFAALSQVGESVRDPGKYCLNNISGTINLLESMRRHGVPFLVFSSTAAVYGEPDSSPISEDSPLEPINAYGFSKLTIERTISEYVRAYGLRAVCLRYFNVVGADGSGRAGEWHEPETHLIPNVIGAIVDGREFHLFGDDYDTPDGTCIRDYIDVRDLVRAHFLALEYLDSGGESRSINLGTRNGYSVKQIVASCQRVIGKPLAVAVSPRRPGDPASLVADSSLARELLGWEPEYSLDESISCAYSWYLRKQSGFRT